MHDNESVDRSACCSAIVRAWSDSERVFNSRTVLDWFSSNASLSLTDVGDREILTELARFGPKRLSDLADAIGRSPSNVSKIVQNLVTLGHVDRSTPDGDRRVTVLSLTESGRRAHDQMQVIDRKLVERHLASFSDDEIAQFAALLTRFAESVTSWWSGGAVSIEEKNEHHSGTAGSR